MGRRRKGEGSVRYRKERKAYEIRLTVAGRVKSVYVPGPRTRERDREVELLRRKLVLAYGLSRGVGEVPELLDWLAAHAEALRVEGRRENTLYQYGRYMALVEAYLGNPRLDRLTPEALEGFFYRLVAQGYSRSVVLHVRHFLHAALERAVRYGYLGVNPVELTQTPKLPSREAGREIGEEELIRILEVARGHRLFAAFYLLAAYGLRRGEVLGLMWPDVDFEKGLLHIRRALVRSAATGKPFLGPTKTSGSNRVLPLTEEAAEVLFVHRERLEMDDLYHPEGLVFPSLEGTPIRPENFRRAWFAVLEKAGVPRARLHDLRGTFITRVVRETGNPKLAAALAGHKSLAVALQHYTRVSQEDMKAAIRHVRVLPSLDRESREEGGKDALRDGENS